MTRAQVIEAANVLRDAALSAESRAAHALTGAARERALREATRLWERERHLRSLGPRASLREIGRAA